MQVLLDSFAFIDFFVLACLAPVVAQGACLLVDEFKFHHARGLGLWERYGHPLDTLSVLVCFLVPTLFSFGGTASWIYVALCAFSCVFVTKDEGVHTQECGAAEHRLHALLFVLHPLVFTGFGLLWAFRPALVMPLAVGQVGLLVVVMAYQLLFWVILGKGRWPSRTEGVEASRAWPS